MSINTSASTQVAPLPESGATEERGTSPASATQDVANLFRGLGTGVNLDPNAVGKMIDELSRGDYGSTLGVLEQAGRNSPTLRAATQTAAFAGDAYKTFKEPRAGVEAYSDRALRGADAFNINGPVRDALAATPAVAQPLSSGQSVEKALPGGATNVATQALGLTPEQTNAAKSLYRAIASGGITNTNGGVDWSKASQLTPLLGELGLMDPQAATRLCGTLDSLSRGDVLGATANLAGVDASAVKSLLGNDSTPSQRSSAALGLFGLEVPPEQLEKAASDIGQGNFASSIDALAAIGGDGTVGQVANGLGLANNIYEAAQGQSTTGDEWASLAAQGAGFLGLDQSVTSAIRAAPALYGEFSELTEGGVSTDAALGASADLARALIPGQGGELAGSVLDAFAGESINYENLTLSALGSVGVDEGVAEVGGDVANVVTKGANVSSIASLSGSVLGAAGAPKEFSSAATVVSGVAAGGVTGYGAVAMGMGELIGGDVGKVAGEAGAYAAAAAGGPVGWAAGAFMLASDLFGYKPPRKADVPTQNGAFMGEGQNGTPAVFSATQNGGEDGMKLKVQQLNTEIEQKPEAMREPQPVRGDQMAAGEVLLNGEWMHFKGDESSDVRAGIDPALGFVVQKKGDDGAWQTTWRADVNPPPGSFVQMSNETGKLEVFAPAESVVPGGAAEGSSANGGFVKIWQSNNGEAAPEGRENILYLAESGGFGQAQRNSPDDGEDVDWDVAKFTEQNDSGFLGSGLGGSHSEADGGHMVSQAGTTDYETSGDYGYFDHADQLMQQIIRDGLTDLAFKSEDGEEYVLYSKGDNQFDEMTKQDYDARVAGT